jgi:hypothetical protein
VGETLREIDVLDASAGQRNRAGGCPSEKTKKPKKILDR